MRHKPLSGLRLGVLGKGGAGKSTITVLLARALRRSGYSVLVFDADSSNVGVARALGGDREPAPLLDHFGGMVFAGGRVTCPVDDPAPLQGAEIDLEALPDRYRVRTDEGIWLLAGGKLGSLGPGAGCDGPIAKIARDLRVAGIGPDAVMLVDYKAGMEDAARGAVTSLDWALAVVDPTTAALRLATDLASTIEAVRSGALPATRHLQRPDLVDLAVRFYRGARMRGVLAVLNRVPDAEAERHLRRSLRAGDIPVAAVFPDEADIAWQWLRGERVGSAWLLEAADHLVTAIEEVHAGSSPPARSRHATGRRREGGARAER